MAFDPLSWAIGFVLTNSAKSLQTQLWSDPKDLASQLLRAVEDWASRLSEDEWVHPSALFPDIIGGVDGSTRPSLMALREELQNQRIPSQEAWKSAIAEQWRSFRSILGKDAQAFFLIEESTALQRIDDLAAALHKVTQSNESLFKAVSLSHLGELLMRARTGAVLPSALEPGLSMRERAQHVEAITGSTIHALYHERGTGQLFAWGEFFGETFEEKKWAMLAVACALSRYPDVNEIVVGPSELSELPRTDGGGPIGMLRFHFPVAIAQPVSKTKIVPIDLWASVRVSVCTDANGLNERWHFVTFREFMERT